MRSRLAAIVEYSIDAIIGTNLDGNITDWNNGAEKMFGYCHHLHHIPPSQRQACAAAAFLPATPHDPVLAAVSTSHGSGVFMKPT